MTNLKNLNKNLYGDSMNEICFIGAVYHLRGQLGVLNAPNKKEHELFIKTNLMEYSKKIRCKDFTKSVMWLFDINQITGKKNFDVGQYYKFPSIPDFKTALSATGETYSNYEESPAPTNQEQNEVAKIARVFINDFAKKYPNPEKKEKPNVYKMYRKMRDQGKVFEYGSHRWVDKKDVVGDYIDPEVKLRDELHI